MKHERKVVILSGLLAALLLAWGLGMVFSPERRSARAEAGALLGGKVEEAVSVELRGTEKLTFEKSGDSWILVDGSARFPAQGGRLTSFLETLAGVKRLRHLASSKEAWKDFQLEDASAKAVLVRDAKGLVMADFRSGGYGPTGSEVYLRRADSDSSYAADSAFASYLTYSRRSWLDLKLLPGAPPEQELNRISFRATIQLDGKDKSPLAIEYSLDRDQGIWTGPAGELDPVATEALARSILSFECEDYVASPPTDSFSPVSARIELSFASGGSRVIEVGSAASEGRFHIRVAGAPHVMLASTYQLKNALKRPEDLLKK